MAICDVCEESVVQPVTGYMGSNSTLCVPCMEFIDKLMSHQDEKEEE